MQILGFGGVGGGLGVGGDTIGGGGGGVGVRGPGSYIYIYMGMLLVSATVVHWSDLRASLMITGLNWRISTLGIGS